MVKPISLFLFTFFCVLITGDLLAKSRYFEWVDSQTALRRRIYIDTYELTAERNQGKWETIGKINAEPNLFNDFPPTWDNHYFYFDKTNKIRFTVQGTGWLFEYDPISRIFKKLDNTFYRGFNFRAIQFVRNNIIYSFGGTGFWQSHAIQTYYVEQRAEWEAIRAVNQGPEKINNFGYNGYSQKQDVFYSGASGDSELGGIKNKATSTEFYQFDFKTKEWALLGIIQKELPRLGPNEAFWNGTYFFVWEGDQLCIIDPEENKVYSYKNNNKIFTTANQVYAKGDTLYNYWSDKGNIEKLSVKEMLSQAEYVGPFYTTGVPAFYYLGGLSFILITGGYFWYRKRQRTYNVLKFDILEQQLLKAFLEKGLNEHLSVNEVNDVLALSSKSQENQRRIRLNIINQINLKVKAYFQIKEAIVRQASEEDKRLNLYHIHPRAFPILKELIN